MKTLYVLYDQECGFCGRCRDWLLQQPAFVELRFIAAQSRDSALRFPGIHKFGVGEDLVVVSDEGAVYNGSSAYLMCLYALVEYREWAERLAHPTLLPLARRALLLLSKNRHRLSKWFFEDGPEFAEERLEKAEAEDPACR